MLNIGIISSQISYPFVSTWNTNNTSSGSSASNQIKLPLVSSGTYNFTVDWGDGSSDVITSWNQAETTHTYASAGVKTLSILGTINGFRFVNSGDRLKITDISQWGNLKLGTNEGSYFYGCSNLSVTATDILSLAGTTHMTSTFHNCSSLSSIPNINDWDVSAVTNMTAMFRSSAFNQDISSWVTSSSISMAQMFFGTPFNQDISSWDVSNVTNTSRMFRLNTVFNQDIGGWNTSSLANTDYMFDGDISFDQDISGWDISSLTSAIAMFSGGATLSTANYDALLIAWAAQAPNINSGVTFSGGNSKYSSAATSARGVLTGTYSWTITDGGLL